METGMRMNVLVPVVCLLISKCRSSLCCTYQSDGHVRMLYIIMLCISLKVIRLLIKNFSTKWCVLIFQLQLALVFGRCGGDALREISSLSWAPLSKISQIQSRQCTLVGPGQWSIRYTYEQGSNINCYCMSLLMSCTSSIMVVPRYQYHTLNHIPGTFILLQKKSWSMPIR